MFPVTADFYCISAAEPKHNHKKLNNPVVTTSG